MPNTTPPACSCPRIDGYVIRRKDCPHHPPRPFVQANPAPEPRDLEADDLACAWADYRKDYGVPQVHTVAAHKAFRAGWSARQGDRSGVLR